MKRRVPKYIIYKIKERARLADRYIALDSYICDWMDKNGVESEYTHGYVETLINPYTSEKDLLEELKRWENE